jgi:MoaA/NifB/PqqE/SkfB family radical SAM enzyme
MDFLMNNILSNPASPSFVRLTVMLTELCNLDCWMCDFARSKGLKSVIPYSPDEIADLLSHRYFSSLKSVTFTGGEPFLYPSIGELYKLLRDKFPDLHLNFSSNAILLKKILKVFDEVTNWNHTQLFVSIDGIEAHNKQRGSEGSFNKTTGNLLELRFRYPKLKILTKFTITPINFHELKDTHDYMVSKGFEFTAKLLENNPYYTNRLNFEKNECKFAYDKTQLESIKIQLNSIIKNRSLSNKNPRKHELVEQLESLDAKWKRPLRCETPIKGAFLDTNLNFHTCKEYSPVINLKESPLDSLERSPSFKHILECEENNFAKCTRCTSSMRVIKKRRKSWVNFLNI